MKFELENELVQSETSGLYIYKYDGINEVNDIKSLLNYFQNKYGKITNIKCIDNTYNDINVFVGIFNKEMYNNMTILSFECKEKYISFILNKNIKKLMLSYNNTSNVVYDPNNIKYYKRDGRIIKHELNNNTFFLLDENNNWYISPSTYDDYQEFFAEFEEIEAPKEMALKK